MTSRPAPPSAALAATPERVWNWAQQLRGSTAFSEKVFDCPQAAQDFNERLMWRLLADHPGSTQNTG